MIQSWVLSIQREIIEEHVLELAYNGNHSSRLPIIADYNQAAAERSRVERWACRRGGRIQSFGPITWVDPAGNNNYNGLSARFEHRFSQGLYVLNSFTWGKCDGRFRTGAGILLLATRARIRRTFAIWLRRRAPAATTSKFINVTSVVYQLPFGKGQQFLGSVNRVAGRGDRRMGSERHQYRQHGLARQRVLRAVGGQRRDRLGTTAEYRGQAFLRPNVSGQRRQPEHRAELCYFGPTSRGYTFTTPPANAPFGNLGRNAFRAPGLEQWDLAVNKNFRITEGIKLQFRSEFFNVLNHTNFGTPNQQATARRSARSRRRSRRGRFSSG